MLARSVDWFIENPVASNLLMLVMLVGGVVVGASLKREEFPEMKLDSVKIEINYPLATAVEIDNAICVKVQEEISGIGGIKKITTNATEGVCQVVALIHESATKSAVQKDIENAINAIDTFPRNSERPVISEVTSNYALLQIALYGVPNESTRKQIGSRIKKDLLAIQGISQVSLTYARDEEISIEVPELLLRQHGLTIQQVADAVRNNSLDLPAGMIKSSSGQLVLRTAQQRYNADDYGAITVAAKADGSRIALADIAQIRDGFEESDIHATLDDQPILIVDVRRTGDEDILEVANKVRHYFNEAESWLPEPVKYHIWEDESLDLTDRMSLMSSSAISGLVLIVITLCLFMRPSHAFWTGLGMPVALLGAVIFLPLVDISISTFSILAVMLVLGILVDDAVVVGERIYSYSEQGVSGLRAAKLGTRDVSVAVVFGVLTTMATFLPLVFVPGIMGTLAKPIGLVAILILAFSLIESQLILPAHLGHSRALAPLNQTKPISRFWRRFSQTISGSLERFIQCYYAPALDWVIRNSASAISLFVGVLIITLAVLISDRVPVHFFPAVPGERIYATVTLAEGSPVQETERAVNQFIVSAKHLQKTLRATQSQSIDDGLNEQGTTPIIDHIMVSYGKKLIRSSASDNATVGSHYAEVAINLNFPENYQGLSTTEIAAQWRSLTGQIPDAVKQTVDSSMVSAGNPIEIHLKGDDFLLLDQLSSEIKSSLYRIPGVYDIYDTFQFGKQELNISMLPNGYNLGFNTVDLANQVRAAFYGDRVQDIQRGSDEVPVFVRYPADARASLVSLESMHVRTPQGTMVPFSTLAEVEFTRGLSKIERIDGKKVVKVIANLNTEALSADEVIAELDSTLLASMRSAYPNVEIVAGGEAEESLESLDSLVTLFALSIFLVYCLLAIPLKSYIQPFIVMSAIPFGLVGAVAAHFLMGRPFVFFSLLGIVALSGIVVNSSLVLIDRANQLRREGRSLAEAIRAASLERFRPIFLTSATTFIGLVPLVANDDPSTQMLFVPIALSLAGGVLISTLVTLLLIPPLYVTTLQLITGLSASLSLSRCTPPPNSAQ